MSKTAIVLLCVLVACAQAQNWVEFYSNFNTPSYTDTDGWAWTNAKSQNVLYKCGQQVIFGGTESFGRTATLARTFKLPAHYAVKIKVKLWKLDNWGNERMIILVDGHQWETLWGYSAQGQELCGKSNDGKKSLDQTFDIEFKIPHQQSALSVIFTSTASLQASDQSWGISHFVLSYQACPSECGTCKGPLAEDCQMWQPIFWSWFNFEENPDKGDWKVDNGRLDKTVCAGVPFYGGPGLMGAETQVSKIIQDLPPHYRLLIQFQFWKIDSWDNEQGQLFIDRELAWYQNFQFSEGIELCYGGADGKGGEPEKIVNVNYEAPHTFNAVNLRFATTLNEGMDEESFGLRQFYLHVARCADNCLECSGPLPKDCTACIPPYAIKGGVCQLAGDWKELHKEFQANLFKEVSEGWVIRNTKGNEKENANFISECGGTAMVGGFDKFGKASIVSRKWKQLPSHKRLRLVLEVWKIDNWEQEELWIKLDNNIVWSRKFGWSDPGSMDVCGTTRPDSGFENKVRVDVVVGHDLPKVEFIISSSLTKEADIQSWGFRDFQLYYEEADLCATLYTECQYQGESFDLCDGQPNFSVAKIPSNIKSIQVPQDSTVVLYDENEYKGGKIEFKNSQPCIQNYKFSFAQLAAPEENQKEQLPEKEAPHFLSHHKKRH